MKKVLAILISVSMVLTMFSSLSYGYDDAEMSIQETESETVSSAISEEVQVGISEEAEQEMTEGGKENSEEVNSGETQEAETETDSQKAEENPAATAAESNAEEAEQVRGGLFDAGMISVRGSSAYEHINGAVKTVKVNGSEFPEDKCSYKPYTIPWIYGDYVKLYIDQSELRGFLEAEGEDKTEITGWGIQVTGDGNIGNPWTPGLEDAPVLENGQYVFTFPLQPGYGATVKTIDITIDVNVISNNCKITLDANGGVLDPKNENPLASKVIKVKKGVKFSEPDETPFKKMSVGKAKNRTRYIKNYVFDRWTKSGEDVKFPLEIEHDSILEANYKECVYSYDNYYDFKVRVDVDGEEKKLPLELGKNDCYLSMMEDPTVKGSVKICKLRFFLRKDYFDTFVEQNRIGHSDIESVSAKAHGRYNFIDDSDAPVKVTARQLNFDSSTYGARGFYFWEFQAEMHKDWGYFDGGEITIKLKPKTGKFTVTFDAMDGEFDGKEKVEVKSGERLSAPESFPFKSGHHFNGWYRGGKKVSFPLDVKENMKLSAEYSKIDMPNANNRQLVEVYVKVKGSGTEYKLDSGFGGVDYNSDKNPDVNEQGEVNQSIWAWVLKDTIDAKAKDLGLTSAVVESVDVELKGFYDYRKQESLKFKDVAFITHIDEDSGRTYYMREIPITYLHRYGQYEGMKAVYTIQKATEKEHIVTFDSAGGEFDGKEKVEVKNGGKVDEPKSPTKNGYTFKHWALDGGAYNFDSAVTKDLTLVAVYEVVQVGPNPGEQNPGQQDSGEQNPGEQNPGEQNPGQQDPEQDQSSPNQDQGSQSSNEDEKNGDNEIVDVGQEETPLSGVTGEEENKEEHSDLLGTNVNNENNGDSVIVELNQEEVAMGTGVEIDKSSDLALDGGKVASSELPYTKGGTPLKYPYILGGALMVLIGLATKISIKKNK